MSDDTSDAIIVFMTASNGEEAARLADMLVGAHLAACVQILPEMESVYRWQGKIERQGNGTAVRIVGNERARPVGAIDRPPAVGERRHLAHLDNGTVVASGIDDDRLQKAVHRVERGGQVLESGATLRERTVVLREPLAEPQFRRHVGALEIKGFERAGPNPFDVPTMEELVCHRVEQPGAIAAD